jgi:SPP1 family phage portal protein
MEITEIMAIPEFDKALETLCEYHKDKDDAIEDNRKAYDGEHAILDDPDRKDKTVGDTAETRRVVKHTREVITMQERIVESAVTFLFGEPVSLVLNNEEKDALALIQAVWKQNKLDYFNRALARDLFIECKVAELWYIPQGQTADKQVKRPRVSLLSQRTGYKFYPHFDEYGDMDAFTILNTIKDKEGKEVDNIMVQTAEKIYRGTKATGKWEIVPGENPTGKINVVYYEQDKPEWKGVESQINRLEYLTSNHADMNDYNGSPLTQVKGRVSNMPKKEETGKLVVVEGDLNTNTGETTYNGGVEFISWDQSPESIKLEMENLKDTIYSLTQTPDLSFSNVKGISALSGIAIRLMFSDALFKALNKQEIFGPAIERRLSIMKSIIELQNIKMKARIDNADIDVIFNDPLPQAVKELVDALSVARGGEPIMSEESAVRMNPLVTDAEKDIKVLTDEKAQLRSFAESYQ